MSRVAAVALRSGGEPQEALETARRGNLELQAEKAELLVENGYPADYLEEKHHCPLCKDTGHIGSRACACFQELLKEEQRRELSSLLDLNGQCFDNFDFSYYSEEVDPARGVSPRENIGMAYDICLEYARKFGRSLPAMAKNLFLNGGTGLGKTFLSACIAGEVSAAGYSVVYDTAVSILETFEAVRFSRDENEEGRAAIRRFFDCDLLIMDDLGTEMNTGFLLSSLYTLINTRLITGKRTLINSNLSMDEVRRRYTPQILSRLEGEYTTIFFFGEDIRLLKKNRLG